MGQKDSSVRLYIEGHAPKPKENKCIKNFFLHNWQSGPFDAVVPGFESTAY